MLREITIQKRLLFAFSLLILLLIGVGTLSLSSMKTIRSHAAEVETNMLPAILSLGEVNLNLMRVRVFTLRLLLDKDQQSRQHTAAQIQQMKQAVEKYSADYQKTIRSDEELKLYHQFTASVAAYYAAQQQFYTLALQGDLAQAEALLSEINPLSDRMTKDLVAIIHFNEKAALEVRNSSIAKYESTFWLILTIVVIAACIGLLVAKVMASSINTPLQQAVKTAETVAAGDLTLQTQIQGDDELTRLARALQIMQTNLREAIVQIGSSSSQLASAAEELNVVTEESSKALQLQNDEVQQAAAAITQMSAAVDEVAQTALRTSDASTESARLASDGKLRVAETAAVINEMNSDMTDSSEVINTLATQVASIGQVLDVIRAVAEQTNLLALNAAIEAARAGEAGRGFAVVADEVRSLAHRTQVSTGEIEAMVREVQNSATAAVSSITNTGKKASEAQTVVKAAAEVLDRIASRILSISDSNHIIASAAEQQSKVAREIDRNIITISDLAAQTAAGAHQTSASSSELTRLAFDLNTLVARFRV
ncbi:methyl-accepting chemotaxis protein [Rheinheimera mesophila]|uniref:Methyl-accepting chemotaxis protein n=1 Tax=Rheinheimera mesophila TaxID=1547515 RepID=A0A3P3QRA5_9GAMM|nr:methyl-accepting chemotaxis protein [Rheinheimera mesophila]KKL02448.1 chemotaxis protein [Rheinheimera mesophila]RRJ23278.1 methyl-accepting chemotaxis protein [Rheinheimera mesophila]